MKNQIRNKIILWFCAILWLMMANANILAQDKINVTLVKDLKLSEGVSSTFFSSKITQIPTPKVEVFDQKIVFYDEQGDVVFTKEYDTHISVFASQNEKFFQIVRIIPSDTKSADARNIIDLFTDAGKLLWTKSVIAYEGFSSQYFIISNTGQAVEVHPEDGTLIFYNASGEMLKKVDVFNVDKPLFDDLSALKGIFSNQGDLFLLGVTYSQTATPGRKAEIVSFNELGKEIWRFTTKQLRIFKCFISPNNRYAVCSVRDGGFENRTIYILDCNTGHLIAEHKTILAEQVKFFSKNSTDYAVINDLSNRVVTINLSNSHSEDFYSVQGQEKILGVDVSNDLQLIAVAKGTFGSIPHVRGTKITISNTSIEFFDFMGNSLTELPVEGLSVLTRNNYMKFLEGSNKMLIYLKPKTLMVFEIKRID